MMKNKIPIDSKILPFKFPAVKEQQLANGFKFLTIERTALPKIYFRMALAFGNKNDPEGKEGLAQLMAAVIKKGSINLDYYQICDKIEQVGGELDVYVNEDFFYIHGEFLKEHIEVGFKLLSEIIFHPVFPLEEFEKEKHKLLADIENEQSSPQFLAHRRMDRILFGAHPYGKHKNKESLLNIRQRDLIDLHKVYFGPSGAVLVLAGDIQQSQSARLVDKFLSRWNLDTAPVLQADISPKSEESIVYLVDRPGSEQSNILIGNLLFSRNHPDYIPMLVMNKILGGGGSSWLFLYLREMKGFTYGAYSNLYTYLESGIWLANAEVRTEVTVEAIKAFFVQFRKIKENTISLEDLQNAKRYLVGFFPLQNETPSSIAALALKQHLFHLPKNYWDSYLDSINGVTQSDVQYMANKYIVDTKLTLVVVGDARKLAKELNALGKVLLFDLRDNYIK
jgi:zinc protease